MATLGDHIEWEASGIALRVSIAGVRGWRALASECALEGTESRLACVPRPRQRKPKLSPALLPPVALALTFAALDWFMSSDRLLNSGLEYRRPM